MDQGTQNTGLSGSVSGLPGAPLSVRAPAKLNLYLHVLGQRDDGYHEIDSLAIFTASGDTITVQPAPVGSGIHFTARGPFAMDMGPDNENLVIKAADLISRQTTTKIRDVTIELTKRLPVAAGIGGGSSDAAATLRALDRFWELDLGESKLAELGLSLGADVPMCLRREPVFVGGIGENLESAPDLPALSLVLVNPGVALATPAVFKAGGPFNGKRARFKGPINDAETLAELLRTRRNDLTKPATIIEPLINDVLHILDQQPGCLLARMSGSGATCFGLFADSAKAETARKSIHTVQPGWWADYMMVF